MEDIKYQKKNDQMQANLAKVMKLKQFRFENDLAIKEYDNNSQTIEKNDYNLSENFEDEIDINSEPINSEQHEHNDQKCNKCGVTTLKINKTTSNNFLKPFYYGASTFEDSSDLQCNTSKTDLIQPKNEINNSYNLHNIKKIKDSISQCCYEISNYEDFSFYTSTSDSLTTNYNNNDFDNFTAMINSTSTTSGISTTNSASSTVMGMIVNPPDEHNLPPENLSQKISPFDCKSLPTISSPTSTKCCINKQSNVNLFLASNSKFVEPNVDLCSVMSQSLMRFIYNFKNNIQILFLILSRCCIVIFYLLLANLLFYHVSKFFVFF